jgi:hypothetical protein
MTYKPDDAAFPSHEFGSTGLTKREYFAIKALEGLLASEERNFYDDKSIECVAVERADLLIAELNK